MRRASRAKMVPDRVVADDAWRQMTPIEQLMLLETSENNPVFITTIFSIASNPSLAWLREHLVPRLLSHPRFRSIPQRTRSRGFEFNLQPDFTPDSPLIDRHIAFEDHIDHAADVARRHALFTERLNGIMSDTLPTDRPLWKLFVFPAFSVVREGAADDCSTIVLRVHHSVADGIGLVKFFAAEIVDNSNISDPAGMFVVPDRQKHPPRQPTTAAAAASPDEAADAPMRKLVQPPAEPTIFSSLREAGTALYRSMLQPIIPEHPNVFTRAPIGHDKVCALIPPTTFSVQLIKDTSRRLGVTINDLLLAAVSGATAAYLGEHGDNPTELRGLRCGIPMNRHMFCEYELSDLSNQMTISPLPLHIHEPTSALRLQRCTDTMCELKRSIQPRISLLSLKLVSLLPLCVRYPLWKHITRCSSLLFTNVPGPRQAVSVSGVPIECIHFFAPGDGHSGVVVSLFSYNGGICLGIQGDKGRVSDPQRYVDLLKAEIETFIKLSRQ